MLTANPDDGTHAPEKRPAGERIADALIGRLDGVSDGRDVGAALGRSWVVIVDALGPILGQRGVVALYRRSLQLSSPAHPWLEDLERRAPAAIDLSALETAFAAQADPERLAAARGILRALCDLMVSLVGVPLTERLLGPVLPEIPPDTRPETLR